MAASDKKLLRVGELAKKVGKTVRAVHLYEELGLLRPATRTEGGFRLYEPHAVDRISWVVKLQAIGFKLSEIQEFVKGFELAASGRQATDRTRSVFGRKLGEIRDQIGQLQSIERDLVEALGYLDACQDCSTNYLPVECNACEHHGHERGSAPQMFANLTQTVAEDLAESGPPEGDEVGGFDVAVGKLTKSAEGAQTEPSTDGSGGRPAAAASPQEP
ncbi:MerR family transcriptional regulator [Haliangium sp.]|uniref:MerR family transcriptional regulator n=1 Tax=Haliangium sp. TaxID=2663208 RepID=UPI003D0BFB71